MHHYIVLLSDLSYALGLIGVVEYQERRAVANWLSEVRQGQPDPRHRHSEEREYPREPDNEEEGMPKEPLGSADSAQGDPAADHRRHFLALNQWMFTLGDSDCYPAVPHGHLHRKTNEWPKLNPYTGRVFSDVHIEDPTRLLSKADMKLLWNDDKFVEHCRKQVLWYNEFSPSYGFPRARFGKLKFPKW